MMYRLAARLPAAVVLIALAAPLGQPAQAQVDSREGIALQNQILELRRQVQILQSQSGRGGPSPTYLGQPGYPSAPPPSGGSSDLVAQLLSRVSTLEEQVRQLRGQIDETQNQVQRQNAELGKRIDDMAFQAQSPQGGPPRPMPPPAAYPTAPPAPSPYPGASPVTPQPSGGLALLPPPSSLGTPGPAPPGVPPGPTGPVRRTPELAMQEGNAALARRDYATAEQSAREVLSTRTSPRAYDAQFLLAQALMGQRQYSQAAIAFDDAYNRSKKGVHAPDALIGLANALLAINEKNAACDTLAKLRGEYPSPRPDIRDAVLSTGQRAGCR